MRQNPPELTIMHNYPTETAQKFISPAWKWRPRSNQTEPIKTQKALDFSRLSSALRRVQRYSETAFTFAEWALWFSYITHTRHFFSRSPSLPRFLIFTIKVTLHRKRHNYLSKVLCMYLIGVRRHRKELERGSPILFATADFRRVGRVSLAYWNPEILLIAVKLSSNSRLPIRRVFR